MDAWDPLAAKLKARREEDLVNGVPATALRKPNKVKWWYWKVRRTVAFRWVDLILVALTVGALIGALVLLATGWPWTSAMSTSAGVVVGAATATAFASVLLTILTTQLRSAVELSSGYGLAVFEWGLPWLAATAQVLVGGFLFVLASLGPTQRSATAGGLLAAAQFGVVWLVARQILARSDPNSIAERYVRQLRRRQRTATRVATGTMRLSLRRQPQRTQILDRLTASAYRDLATSLIRQMGDGARTAVARGQAAPARTLWQGAQHLFVDYARGRAGDVGGFEGPIQSLLDLGEAIVEHGDRGGLRELAAQTVRSMAGVATEFADAAEYAVVRTLTHSWIANRLNHAWNDDASWVPTQAVQALDGLSRHFFAIGAVDDGLASMGSLMGFAQRAIVDNKPHVAVAATACIANLLPVIVDIPNRPTRHICLGRWRAGVTSLTPLSGVEAGRLPIWRATDALLPGISLNGHGLAETVWDAGKTEEVSRDIVETLLDWLENALPLLAQLDRPDDTSLVEAGLSMLYTTAVFAAVRVKSDRQLAGRVRRTSIAWIPIASGAARPGALLLRDDIAELIWSTNLAASYLDGGTGPAADAARWMLAVIALDFSVDQIESDYGRSFLSGLMILAGVADVVARSVLRERTPNELRTDGGIHLPPFARGPRMNRSHVAASAGVHDRLESWVLAQWPQLDASPPASRAQGRPTGSRRDHH